MVRSIFLTALISVAVFTKPTEPTVIEIKADKELIPEGIAVHPVTKSIYLSSLHKNKIIAVDTNGNVRDLITTNQDGYIMGLGMKIDAEGKTLWSCTAYNDSTTHKTGLLQIDLATGRVLQKFMRTEETNCFMNDLVIDKHGNIYITDTEQSSVFRWDNQTKKLERWLQHESLKWANGIALSPDEQTLYVASGRYGIRKIDIATPEGIPTGQAIQPIAGEQTDFYAVDGLGFYKNSLIGVIGYPQDDTAAHRVLRFHLDGDNMLDRSDTLDINSPYLNTPTTLSIVNDDLYVLAKTNLGIYNRHNADTGAIRDSLENALVVRYRLTE